MKSTLSYIVVKLQKNHQERSSEKQLEGNLTWATPGLRADFSKQRQKPEDNRIQSADITANFKSYTQQNIFQE